jgi:5-oxoprolinase (ATP-hydrolysing) subunit A
MKIDLNCDMGESFGTYKLGYDEELMPFVTSINVACGFHASDPGNMLYTVRLAKKHQIAIGAHPSFPDLVGFGRRNMAASPAEIRADTLYQIGALWAICQSEGVRLQHVKPHGALYSMAAADVRIAGAIAEAIKAIDPELYMICLGKSKMVQAAEKAGVKYVEEAFADRAYTNEGTLVPRSKPGAVIHDVNLVAERVLSIVKERKITSIDGKEVPVVAQTVCVHGDTPGAVAMIKLIRKRLQENAIAFAPFGRQR